MTHEHDPIVGSDKIIRCRICGELLSHLEEVLGRLTSFTRARRFQDEIAWNGGYVAAGYTGLSVIYSRRTDGLVEEVTVRKMGDRKFEVVKKISVE